MRTNIRLLGCIGHRFELRVLFSSGHRFEMREDRQEPASVRVLQALDPMQDVSGLNRLMAKGSASLGSRR